MEAKPKSYTEQLQDLVRKYRAAGEPWPTDSRTIASWLIRSKEWAPPRKSAIDILAPQLSTAMRNELFTDPQGRRVRKMHAVRETEELPDGTHRQHVIWIVLDDPTNQPKRVRNAMQGRRGQILHDCNKLKTDVDSYNENWNSGPTIEMVWDFTDDLLEMEQSAEYPESGEEEDGDEENERV